MWEIHKILDRVKNDSVTNVPGISGKMCPEGKLATTVKRCVTTSRI